MPKKRKYPKQPRAGASIETWNRYKAKCQEVKKHNDALKKRPQQIAKIKSDVRKMRG